MADDAEDPPVEVLRVDRPLEVVEALLLELAHVNAVEAGPELRGSVDLGAGRERIGHRREDRIFVGPKRSRHQGKANQFATYTRVVGCAPARGRPANSSWHQPSRFWRARRSC